MNFKLEVNCDNAAFDDESGGNNEVSNLLHQAAMKVGMGQRAGGLRDSNGNTVGRFEFTA